MSPIGILLRKYTCIIGCRKSNRFEILTQGDEGLIYRYTRVVYGRITMLERLRPENSKTEHLFIGTDRYKYFTISWDEKTSQIRTEQSYQDQSDKTLRDSQSQDRCLIDPSRRYMTLQLFDGIVNVVPINQARSKRKGSSEPGTLGQPVPARISELFVRSSVFLHSREETNAKTLLALLYENNRQQVCLHIRHLDYTIGTQSEPGSADLEEVVAAGDDLDIGASHLIPIPAPACT